MVRPVRMRPSGVPRHGSEWKEETAQMQLRKTTCQRAGPSAATGTLLLPCSSPPFLHAHLPTHTTLIPSLLTIPAPPPTCFPALMMPFPHLWTFPLPPLSHTRPSSFKGPYLPLSPLSRSVTSSPFSAVAPLTATWIRLAMPEGRAESAVWDCKGMGI